VSIRDLRVSTVIGVYDWERETEQALTFSVAMVAEVAKAAARDDIGDALDYSAVAQTVKTVVIEASSNSSRPLPSASRSALLPTTASPGSVSRSSSRSPPRATRPPSPSNAVPHQQSCSKAGSVCSP
jgi:hypothetical protein